MTGEITKESIAREFPHWGLPFRGVDQRWHAEISGATPPVRVHDDDLEGLREEIQREDSKRLERAWTGRHRPNGPAPAKLSGG
jgi:hypothetical protein